MRNYSGFFIKKFGYSEKLIYLHLKIKFNHLKKQRSNVQSNTEFYSWITAYGGKASWFGTLLE